MRNPVRGSTTGSDAAINPIAAAFFIGIFPKNPKSPTINITIDAKATIVIAAEVDVRVEHPFLLQH